MRPLVTLGAVLALALVAGGARGSLQRLPESESTRAMIALVGEQEDQLLGVRGSPYRYAVVRDVRPETRRALLTLVRENPQTRVLLYTNAGFMVHDPTDPKACSYWPFNGDGVDFCRVSKRRESWFLHDVGIAGQSRSTRLRSGGYPASWAADIGDPGYQRAWIRNVKRRLRGRGPGGTRVRVAGVFIDDLNLQPGHGLDGRIAEYSDAAYGEAAQAFGAGVSARLARRGYMTMANVGLDVTDAGQRANLVRLAASGLAINREYFVRYGTGEPLFTTPATGDGGDWLTQLELFEAAQGANGYMAMVYGGAPGLGPEFEAAQYGRATFLLGWDGTSRSALAFRTTDGSNPAEFQSWQAEIGKPLEARLRVGDGHAYQRRYSRGIALANADPSSSQLFVLDGLYRNRAGICATVVVLAPTSGRVMEPC